MRPVAFARAVSPLENAKTVIGVTAPYRARPKSCAIKAAAMANPPKQISQDGPFSNERASTMVPSHAKQEAAALRPGFDRWLGERDFVLLVTNPASAKFRRDPGR